MSIQGMISSLKNNNRRKNRDSVFTKDKNQTKSSFGEFVDHKQMNTYEFAAFQKKVFKEKRKQKKKTRILIFVSIILAIGILLTLPYIIDVFFSNDYLDLVL